MVKGVHRRMVEVKLKRSKNFESACLIFKTEAGRALTEEREVLEEAEKIINAINSPSVKSKGRSRARRVFASLLLFAAGLFAGLCISYFIF